MTKYSLAPFYSFPTSIKFQFHQIFPTRFRRAFISDNEAVQILLAEIAFRMRNHVPNEHRERLVGEFEHEHKACNLAF